MQNHNVDYVENAYICGVFSQNSINLNYLVMKLKLSNEKIKSLSIEDFLLNVIQPIVQKYSLAEIVSLPKLQCINTDYFNEVFVKIATKDALMIDVFSDIIPYCNLYFGSKRATVIISGSKIHSEVVVYTVILFK